MNCLRVKEFARRGLAAQTAVDAATRKPRKKPTPDQLFDRSRRRTIRKALRAGLTAEQIMATVEKSNPPDAARSSERAMNLGHWRQMLSEVLKEKEFARGA